MMESSCSQIRAYSFVGRNVPASTKARTLFVKISAADSQQQVRAHETLPIHHRASVLGYWVRPCGTRLGIRKGGNGAYAYPRSQY